MHMYDPTYREFNYGVIKQMASVLHVLFADEPNLDIWTWYTVQSELKPSNIPSE